eukprot:4859727-Lingulodinium_polyedra.AAC.1
MRWRARTICRTRAFSRRSSPWQPSREPCLQEVMDRRPCWKRTRPSLRGRLCGHRGVLGRP